MSDEATTTSKQRELFRSDVKLAGAVKRCARVFRDELPDGWALHKAMQKLREAQAAALMADLEALAPEPRPEVIEDGDVPY